MSRYCWIAVGSVSGIRLARTGTKVDFDLDLVERRTCVNSMLFHLTSHLMLHASCYRLKFTSFLSSFSFRHLFNHFA